MKLIRVCLGLSVLAPIFILGADPTVIGIGPGGPFRVVRRPASRTPAETCTPPGNVVGAAICSPMPGREWEGIASTDYFSFEPSVFSPPNPEIAVGPNDVLTVVNRTILRYPNPNAERFNNDGGTAPVSYIPSNTFYYPATSRQFLDVWLGEAALNELCPTFPRSNASCEIGNASVRYDQMQGRWLVLFTVIDTGLINCAGCPGVPTPQTAGLTRKASWVLMASRWPTGCSGAPCVPSALETNDAPPPFGQPDAFFGTAGSPAGAAGNSNWMAYYGKLDGSCDSTCTGGNINSISDLRRGASTPAGARTIDCSNAAVGVSSKVCYFPSSARLGIDHDNIIITSSVYDDNVLMSQRSVSSPAWEGTRVRVLKKAAVYAGATTIQATAAAISCTTALCPGAAQGATPQQGDLYDLWADSTTPYAIDKTVGGLKGMNYEPAHVRGRSLASFDGNGGLAGGFTSLVGAIDAGFTGLTSQQQLYMRSISYTATVLPAKPGVGSNLFTGGIPALLGLETVGVPGFKNPNTVKQKDKLSQPPQSLPTPALFVGDNRPHRVIAREGQLYGARVLSRSADVPLDGAVQDVTVAYDVIRKTGAGTSPSPVLHAHWTEGAYYSPMFDVPVNVVQNGTVGTGQLISTVFTGTTNPALLSSDTRTFAYAASAAALTACKGSTLAYPGLFDLRCGEDAYDAVQFYRNPITGSFTPSDFNVPAQPAPFPNQIVPFGIRGGASTDPNTLGLWLYGAYAKARLASVPGFGQWGTYLTYFPLHSGGDDYSDVPSGSSISNSVSIFREMGIDPTGKASPKFWPEKKVTREEAAIWIVRSQMDDAAVDAYLNATGGFTCSFSDVACPQGGGQIAGAEWRYIEVAYRRGYTRSCSAPNAPKLKFCPKDSVTRGETAALMVRARFSQVHPPTAATLPPCTAAGTKVSSVDQSTAVTSCTPYFSDVAASHPYFAHIQKFRELGITRGVALATESALATFAPSAPVNRADFVTFLVRSFFP